jgi:hypothetical protein
MSKTALHVKRARAKRRLDSAIAGGVFASQRDLELRWGCNPRTAAQRIKDARIPQYAFAEKAIRYRLSDIEAYERQAQAKGLELRAQQLREKGSK